MCFYTTPFFSTTGQVAQLVERGPEKAGVGGSIPSLATNTFNNLAIANERVKISRAYNTRTLFFEMASHIGSTFAERALARRLGNGVKCLLNSDSFYPTTERQRIHEAGHTLYFPMNLPIIVFASFRV